MSNTPLRDIFGEFLVEKGASYEDLVVLDSDLSASTRTSHFGKKYPERFFNMGIAEQNLVGTSIGLAISGKIPVVSGFSIFLTGRAWEFIRMACHDNLNIKFISTHGGFVGEDGSSHNALEDITLMSILSNMHVIVPTDEIELKSVLNHALENEGPYYIRLPRSSLPRVHAKNYKFSSKKSDVIKDGTDICIIGTGYGTGFSKNNVNALERELDISIKIINQSLIKPIPELELISELKSIKRILVIEEHNSYCGLGSIISRIISNNQGKIVRILGIKKTFGESGSREAVLDKYGFNYENLKFHIENLLTI